LEIGAEMKIAIGAGFPAKWNMNVNTGQEGKNELIMNNLRLSNKHYRGSKVRNSAFKSI
jgi:hypothetical protein